MFIKKVLPSPPRILNFFIRRELGVVMLMARLLLLLLLLLLLCACVSERGRERDRGEKIVKQINILFRSYYFINSRIIFKLRSWPIACHLKMDSAKSFN